MRRFLILRQQTNSDRKRWGEDCTSPRWLRDHAAHLDTLPFDGMLLNTPNTERLMDGGRYFEAQIAEDFAPMDGLRLQNLRRNFAHVNTRRPADFFGDWSATIESFRALASVCRKRNLVGVWLDDEEYAYSQDGKRQEAHLWNFPDDADDPKRGLAAYREQARRRGRELMTAVCEAHPGIALVAALGPSPSFERTPEYVTMGQSWRTFSGVCEPSSWRDCELRGAFFAGLLEGKSPRASVIDGGKFYAYRTAEDFARSYEWRKRGIASAEADCPFIPPPLRRDWSKKAEIAFVTYNFVHPEGRGLTMNPAVIRPTIVNALRRTDRFVFLFTEFDPPQPMNWCVPGGIGDDWRDAVLAARRDAGLTNAERNI